MADSTQEEYWLNIRSLAQARKYDEIQSLIENSETGKACISLYRFAIRGLMFREWTGNNLTPIVLLGDAAVALALKLYQQDTNDKSLQDEANVICYNMAANLAGCWNDGFARSPEHYRIGLEYANRAIAFRTELKKGASSFSMAYWAKAVHELFLNNFVQAEHDFAKSLQLAEESAVAGKVPIGISKSSDFSVLLGIGYLAIAQITLKNFSARQTFQQVLDAFEDMKEASADSRGDAEVGLDQLRYTFSKVI